MRFKKLLCVIMSLLLAFQTITPALADDSRVYYCNQEEHTHTDECYTIYKILSCEEEHTHIDECFQVYKFLDCELPEHIHNNKCEEEDYKEEQLEEKQEDIEIIEKAIKGEEYFSIICEKEEHIHEKSCFDTVLNCNEEHEHEKSCYIDEIICEKEEHTHIIDCVLDETPITNYDIEDLKEDFEGEGFVTLQECNDKLLTNKELEKTTIENIDAMLKSAVPQEGIEPTVLPVTVDGISIEKATMRWLSKSTGSNTPAKFDDLVLVPPNNTMPNQQWQLDFALSGKGFIEPGDLEIVIPAYIWKDRGGNQPGRLTLAVPEEPEMNSYGLSWKRVEDTYVITNAKKLSAGEKFMIQGTFRMTYPDPNSDKPFNTTPASAMVDIDTTDENAEYKGISDWLYADILVITPHNHEELSARTNAIRATVNTKVEVTSCEKKVVNSSDIYISAVPNILDLLPDNPEDYYYVRWYISGKANGNQPYTLTLREELTDEYDGILLGFTNGVNQIVNERDGSVDVYTGDDFNTTKSTYVWTAYPKSSFPEPNTVYTVTNKVIAEVSGVDDKIVTTKEAVASASLRTPTTYYIDKVWEYNDDKYDTDLETIMSRRPNSITVGISGSGFTDTLSDDNNWHTEYTENNGRYYSPDSAWESGQGNSNYTYSPRIYYTDGRYSYTRTGWGWELRRNVFDKNTNTWTFYNQYLETTRLYGGWVRTATYDKTATNHTNYQVRATTDRDLILLRDNKETTDITYRVVRSSSIIPYTSDGTNLHSNTVRLEITDHTEYLNNRKLNEDEYYFTFATLPNPTVSIWGGSNSGYSNSTKIAAEMWGKVDSEWIKFGEIDTDGNITTFNEATVNGTKLVFPTDAVKQTKLVAKTNADWIYASYGVGIKIKPSEQVKEQVENEFVLTDYVMMTSKNDATFSIVNDEDGTVLNSVDDSATTYLHGRNYRLAVDLDKIAIYTKNDKINRQLWFSNTITLNRVSSIYNKSEFEYAVSENMLADSDTGVFYDLLPAGMRVDESSIKSTNAKIQNINIIENYKNSGRQLLVINADLIDKASRIMVPHNSDKYNNATYPAYQNQEVWGWEPSTITFNMTYSYDEAQNRGLTGLRNHAAYMADEEQFGNLKYWTGEKDIPNGENHTETLGEVREDVRDLMTNLSSDSDYPNTVYAGDTIRITEIDFSALTSLVKQVSITGSDNWSFGHDNEVNVPEGGKYSYRIILTSGTDTTTSDIIILDSIESYTPIKVTDSGDSNIPVGRIISQREFEENNELIAEQNGNLIQGEPAWAWTGYFRGIDVSEITKMGVDAKVYYSTVKGLDISQYNPDGEADIIPNILLDEDIWSLTPPTDLSEVTGIAIDCRKDIHDEDFKLRENESLIAYIHMKAPTHEQQPEAFGDEYKDYLQNAHAFNNAYMDITQQDYLGFTTHSYDHFDFTQVGIYGLDIEVIKVWDDTNDNDRIRPNNLEIELVANGVDTGRIITLNNETWKGIFDHVIEFDDNGDRINYTVKENNVEDYTSSYTKTTDGNLTTITLTNKHELYKVNYPFSKIWLSEEPSGWEVNIPSSITVKLYADDIFTGKTKTITPDENGDWYGEFTNLQKLKDGEEIVYSIKEVYINSDWIVEYEGSTIKNTYYPYGNLIVQKKVINSTPESKDNLFKFVIVLTDKNDNDLIGEFDYIITDENNDEISSGKIKNGDGFELKENWKIEIIEIPSGSKYIVQEKNKDGYSIESENSSNTISSEKVQEAIFTNTYNTQGTTSILGNKTLTGRDITRNQFRFELYEGNKLIRTAANTVEGSFNFGTFTYTTVDNGKEFIYTVKEIDRGRDGYTYDTTIYTIKVYPVDNGDGTMTVTKKIYLDDEEVDIIEFNNEYHAEGEIVLKAWKELKGRKLQNEEFEFELLDTDGQIIQTKKNSADGSIIFDAIHFDETDIGKTYYYTIREKAGEDETVNYDSNIYGYSVQVIDNGNGTLSFVQNTIDVSERFVEDETELVLNPDWQPTEGELPIFKNTLKDGSLSLQKTTENDENANPDQEFKFKIKLIGEDIENKSYDIEKEILPYNAYLTYDANGGKFSDGETENKLTYLVQNGNSTLTEGEYEEPTRDGYTFKGWHEDEEFNTEFTGEPEELSLTENKRVYTKWEKIPVAKYAVQIYGIGQDVDIDGNIMGLTFGPAIGGNYVQTTKPAHISPENETEIDMCIHNHTWSEIIAQNKLNPNSFHNCITGQCTKTIELDIPTEISGTKKYFNKITGDGVGVLNYTSGIYLTYWNATGSRYGGTGSSTYDNNGGWGTSNIRAILNGVDTDSSDGITTTVNTFAEARNITADKALIAAFPQELQDAIGYRTTKYDSKHNQNTIYYLKTVYDKLFLLSPNEMNLTEDCVYGFKHPLEADFIYKKFENDILTVAQTEQSYLYRAYGLDSYGISIIGCDYSLRSIFNGSSNTVCKITAGGCLTNTSSNRAEGIAPCFALKRSQAIQSSVTDGLKHATNTLSETPRFIKDSLRNSQTSIEFVNGEAEVILKKNEKIIINNIPAGTTYQIYEETPDGWILVEQRNASGEILPLETSEAEFKNRYQPGITSVQFNGSKFLDNRPASENSFSFELWEGDNLLETVSVLDGGFIQFSVISYTEAGTYHYTIKEVNPNSDTIDYDTHIESITVEVIDNGNGTMSSEVSYDSDGIIFRNNTRPGTLEIKKTAQTTNANKDDEFTFEIEFTNENGTPLSNDENVYWYKKDANGNIIQSRNSLMRGLSKLNEEIGLEKNKSKIWNTDIEENKDEPKLRNSKNGGDGDPYESQSDDIVPWTTLSGNIRWRISSSSTLYLDTTDGQVGILSKSNASRTGNRTEIRGSTTYYRTYFCFCYYPWQDYEPQKIVFLADIEAVEKNESIFNSNATTNTRYYPYVFSSSIKEVYGFEHYKGITMYSYYDKYNNFQSVNLISGVMHLDGIGNNTLTVYDTRVYVSTAVGDGKYYKNNEGIIYNNLRSIQVYANTSGNYIGGLVSPSTAHFTGYWVSIDDPSLYYTAAQLKDLINSGNGVGHWQWERCNILFDENGGIYVNGLNRRYIADDDIYLLPVAESYSTVIGRRISAPSTKELFRNGYKLLGFSSSPSATKSTYTPNSSIAWSRNVRTLYAVWEYDGKNQINVNHYQETVDGEYVLVDTDVIRDTPGTEHSPELKNYAGFHAISSVETVIVDDEELVTVNYYYDRDRYNIKFDGNGNTSGQMFDTISCIGGISTVLPKNTYSKKGLVFTGWNTQPDGSGMSYLDQSTVVNIGQHGETITLYAQWGDNANIILPTSGKIYVTCKAGETIVIPDLPYGTKYTIKEVDLPNGWSFNSSTGEIGSISANNISSAEFTNRYSSDGIAYIVAHKRIQGDTPQEGQFTFELYRGNTLLQTKTNGAVDTNEEIAGNEENIPNPWYNTAPIEFDALHFTQDDIGKTFTYTIKEVNTGDNRINYDTHTETVRITVSDAGGGNLSCNVTYDTDGALFTNSLKDGNLQLKKDILNPTETSEDTEFEFTIKLTDNSGNPINGTYPVKIKHKNYGIVDKNVNVEKYSHTSNIDDTGKQLRNYLNRLNTTEVISIPGATSLIVDIYYNGESISYDWLSVWKGNYPNYKASSNTTSEGYVTTEDGAPNNTNKFGGSKNGSYTVNGNALTNIGYTRLTIPGDTVTFGFRSNGSGVGRGYGYYAIITPLDDEGNPLTVVVPEEQGFTETTISNNGTLTLKGGEELEITGLPDGAIYEIIEVEKDGWTLTNSSNTTGTIVAGETANVKFENTYSTQGQFTPTANKIYTNGDLSEETFNFIVMDENGNQVSKGITDENGDIIFDTIYYSQEDDGKIFAYYIQEVIDDREHIIWDEHLSEIIVEVNDNGLGELIATPVITNNDNVFTNEYKTWKISINKQVEGNVGNKEKEFEFTITLTNNIRTITYIKGEENGEFNTDTFTFTLRHGETIEFSGIGDGIEYIITENDYSSENYTTIIKFNGETLENREISGNIEEDIDVRYINTSDVAVPTKVNNTNISLFILVLPIAGLFIIIKRRRRMYI